MSAQIKTKTKANQNASSVAVRRLVRKLAIAFKAEADRMKQAPLIEVNWDHQQTAAAVMAAIGRCLEKKSK